jgi:hypothetical protein
LIEVDSYGNATARAISVRLVRDLEGVRLEPILLDPADSAGGLASIDGLLGKDQMVGALRTLSVDPGFFLVVDLADTDVMRLLADTQLDSSLWLQWNPLVGAEPQPVEIEITLPGKNIVFDMGTDEQILVLSSDSTLDLAGGSILVSDGILDVSQANLLGIGDIILNSGLVASLDQLEQLSGHLVSDIRADLYLAVESVSDVDRTLEFLEHKVSAVDLSVLVEAKAIEAQAYLATMLESGVFPDTITIEQVVGENDAPTGLEVLLSPVRENMPGAVLGSLSVLDVDLDEAHVFTVSDDRFVVDGGELRLMDGVDLDFEAEPHVELSVTATDRGGLSVTRDVTVLVEDVNEAPTGLEVLLSPVRENMPGAVLGSLSVLDVDLDEAHVFTVSDGRFVVDGGELRLMDGVDLDFEAEPHVELSVTATDRGGLSVTRDVTVLVEDVNEAPTGLEVGPLRVMPYAGQNIAEYILLTRFRVFDDDLGDTVVTLTGPGASYFQLTRNSIYLKPGTLPEADNLSVTLSVADSALSGGPLLEESLLLPLKPVNALLGVAEVAPVVFLDHDQNGLFSEGDVIRLQFNEVIDLDSLTLDDFTVRGGSLGDAEVVPIVDLGQTGLGVDLVLGAATRLDNGYEISLDPYTIQDMAGAANSQPLSFLLSQTRPGFNIDIVTSAADEYIALFEAAAAIWESVITTDIEDYVGIDDLRIHATIDDIDGRGSVLGYANISEVRPFGAGLPYEGFMVFDRADLDGKPQEASIALIAHEIAHVLGFGTLWRQQGLVEGTLFVGENALREYHELGGEGVGVPLETEGGAGTALFHWSEDIFTNELMTGYMFTGDAVLSRITIGAMHDVGYSVDYAVAEPITLASVADV